MNIIFTYILLTVIVTTVALAIRRHPKNMSVQQGTTVTFNCKANSYDEDITYLWERVDSGELDLTRVIGIHSSRLTISNVLPDDSGSYVCIAHNKDEKAVSRKAVLYVKGLYNYM